MNSRVVVKVKFQVPMTFVMFFSVSVMASISSISFKLAFPEQSL